MKEQRKIQEKVGKAAAAAVAVAAGPAALIKTVVQLLL